MVTCCKCGIDITSTYISNWKICKPCRSAYQRDYYLTRPEKYKRHKMLVNSNEHDMTHEEYEAIKKIEICELCGERPATDIDHDHKTGEYRGHLCKSCNVGLGMFGDSVQGLQNAIAYLSRGIPSVL